MVDSSKEMRRAIDAMKAKQDSTKTKWGKLKTQIDDALAHSNI